ncbi:MAG: hypothetical protein NZ553_17855 [Caldilinea sp.]|nr:hypothetical protein [Caldilinea sp.]MDW8442348.1 hypothetical protein [Caldilineaceae bacterium]
MARTAMFAGLVFDQTGRVAEVTHVGENACYVIYEDDFKRHIDAEVVDRQVLRFMRQQVEGNRDLAVGAILEMIGRDDLFTKAAVESTIEHIEEAVGQPIPEEARQWLGMLGFKIIIDEQGTVVDIQMPTGGVDEGE